MIRDLQFLFGNSSQSSVERAPIDNGPFIQAFYNGNDTVNDEENEGA